MIRNAFQDDRLACSAHALLARGDHIDSGFPHRLEDGLSAFYLEDDACLGELNFESSNPCRRSGGGEALGVNSSGRTRARGPLKRSQHRRRAAAVEVRLRIGSSADSFDVKQTTYFIIYVDVNMRALMKMLRKRASARDFTA